jgi:hypothetical protein
MNNNNNNNNIKNDYANNNSFKNDNRMQSNQFVNELNHKCVFVARSHKSCKVETEQVLNYEGVEIIQHEETFAKPLLVHTFTLTEARELHALLGQFLGVASSSSLRDMASETEKLLEKQRSLHGMMQQNNFAMSPGLGNFVALPSFTSAFSDQSSRSPILNNDSMDGDFK